MAHKEQSQLGAGGSSLWVQAAICTPPSRLRGESAKIPQRPPNSWQWPLGMLCTYDQTWRKASLVPPEKQIVTKQTKYVQTDPCSLSLTFCTCAGNLNETTDVARWAWIFFITPLAHNYLFIYLFTF